MSLFPDNNALVHEIIEAVAGGGSLSKEQVMGAWGLDDAQYGAVQPMVLRDARIEAGPRGTGGFVLRQPKGRLTPETESGAFELNEWQSAAAERLAELFSHRQLEDLLGTFAQLLRQARKYKQGVDRRGSKRELATGLLIRHGADLLADSGVRAAVGAVCNVPFPKRWHPGGNAAFSFVESAGLPRELAGVATDDRRPDFEFIEPRLLLRPLEDFQFEVRAGLLDMMNRAGGRCIVTLPTGAGKTRVAVEAIREWMADFYGTAGRPGIRHTVLWLAHTEELCEQAYQCFKDVWEGSSFGAPLLLFRFWGRYTADLVAHRETLYQIQTRPSVLISTPQRIANLLEGKAAGAAAVAEYLRKAVTAVFVDEAHRAAAPSYRAILADFAAESLHVCVVGLTATPFRMEYMDDPEFGVRELKILFRRLVEPSETLGADPRLELEQRGILARPAFKTVETNVNVAPAGYDPEVLLDVSQTEAVDQKMAVKADQWTRRMKIFEAVLPVAADSGNSVLYFGPTVNDAECMTYLLLEEGIPAAVVSALTRDASRRQIIADFKAGRIRVLCNCEVLTTGFDAPRVTHVVVARPTVSQVLYEQMIGRGLRGVLFGGTGTCTIIDCQDDLGKGGPKLGWQMFRHIWFPGQSNSGEKRKRRQV